MHSTDNTPAPSSDASFSPDIASIQTVDINHPLSTLEASDDQQLFELNSHEAQHASIVELQDGSDTARKPSRSEALSRQETTMEESLARVEAPEHRDQQPNDLSPKTFPAHIDAVHHQDNVVTMTEDFAALYNDASSRPVQLATGIDEARAIASAGPHKTDDVLFEHPRISSNPRSEANALTQSDRANRETAPIRPPMSSGKCMTSYHNLDTDRSIPDNSPQLRLQTQTPVPIRTSRLTAASKSFGLAGRHPSVSQRRDLLQSSVLGSRQRASQASQAAKITDLFNESDLANSFQTSTPRMDTSAALNRSVVPRNNILERPRSNQQPLRSVVHEYQTENASPAVTRRTVDIPKRQTEPERFARTEPTQSHKSPYEIGRMLRPVRGPSGQLIPPLLSADLLIGNGKCGAERFNRWVKRCLEKRLVFYRLEGASACECCRDLASAGWNPPGSSSRIPFVGCWIACDPNLAFKDVKIEAGCGQCKAKRVGHVCSLNDDPVSEAIYGRQNTLPSQMTDSPVHHQRKAQPSQISQSQVRQIRVQTRQSKQQPVRPQAQVAATERVRARRIASDSKRELVNAANNAAMTYFEGPSESAYYTCSSLLQLLLGLCPESSGSPAVRQLQEVTQDWANQEEATINSLQDETLDDELDEEY